jgi:hypothetical protein
LVEVAKSIIAIEEEMLVRRRNMARYCQDFDSDESNETNDQEQVKPKRKGAKVRFNTYKKVYIVRIVIM